MSLPFPGLGSPNGRTTGLSGQRIGSFSFLTKEQLRDDSTACPGLGAFAGMPWNASGIAPVSPEWYSHHSISARAQKGALDHDTYYTVFSLVGASPPPKDPIGEQFGFGFESIEPG